MGVILSEILKIVKVKAIWFVYIFGMIFVFTMAYNANNGDVAYALYTEESRINFPIQFIKQYGKGPYDKDLLYRYANYYDEYIIYKNDCITENNQCIEDFINKNDELKIYRYNEPQELIYFIGGIKYEISKLENYEKILKETPESYIEKLNKDDGIINNYFKNLYFEQRITDYQNLVNSPKIFIHQIYRESINFNYNNYPIYIYYLSLIISIMLIISIASAFISDATYSLDMLILTSKIGRKIIKYKMLASMLATLFYSVVVYLPFFLILFFKNKLYYFLNIKLKSDQIYNTFLADLTLWQLIIIMILLLVFTQLFIGFITSIISVYSRKIVNTIVYNIMFLLGILIIGESLRGQLSGNDTKLFKQIFQIILVHSPYLFIKNNSNMLMYTTNFNDTYFNNYTYLLYPLVFLIINLIIICFLVFKTIKYYYQMNN